jgi:hypothetical protein
MTKWLPRSVFVVGVVLLGAAANSRAVIKVAKVGDPAPTSVGGTFATFLGQGPVLLGINDHGQVLFWSAISGGNTDAGVFMSSGGVITKVVVNGDPSPLGGVFQDLPPTVPNYSLNNLGQVAFGAGVQGGATGGGLFLFAGGAITKILVDGDPAPAPALVEPVNDPDSFVLSFGFSFHLNDSGAIAIITQCCFAHYVAYFCANYLAHRLQIECENVWGRHSPAGIGRSRRPPKPSGRARSDSVPDNLNKSGPTN